jgi:hypothetical protein
MPFTEHDLREMLVRLQSDTGARRELRDLMRDPVLEQLQSEVAGLAAAERRTGERLDKLAERVEQLAAAQQRTEERLEQLAAAQQRTEERLEQLAAAQQRTEERLAALTERVDRLTGHVERLTDRVGGLVGESLERRYRERAGAYFGTVLRRTRVVDALALEEALEERLSLEELRDGLLTDLIVSGKPRTRPDVGEVWLAVEVSAVVDKEDVRRAARRCRLLTRSGRPVVPVVAGEAITTGADEAARSQQVAVLEDGKIANWDEALEAALGAA